MIVDFLTGEATCSFCFRPLFGSGIAIAGRPPVNLHADCAFELAKQIVLNLRKLPGFHAQLVLPDGR